MTPGAGEVQVAQPAHQRARPLLRQPDQEEVEIVRPQLHLAKIPVICTLKIGYSQSSAQLKPVFSQWWLHLKQVICSGGPISICYSQMWAHFKLLIRSGGLTKKPVINSGGLT